jgi:K+-sensing histidine kinase KdpD
MNIEFFQRLMVTVLFILSIIYNIWAMGDHSLSDTQKIILLGISAIYLIGGAIISALATIIGKMK